MAVCLHCGVEFAPNRIGQKFCCKEHRWRFNASESYKIEKGDTIRDYRRKIDDDDTVDQRYKLIAEYRASGMSYEDIAEILGYKVNTVKGICSKIGLIKSEKENLAEECCKYKAQGHTMKDVANRFNISEATACKICKGIAPQPSITKETRVKGHKTTFPRREARAIEAIKTYCAGFEYIGGFSNVESMVTLRCKNCGCASEYSYGNIRHGHSPECKVCADAERKAKEEAKAKEKEEKKRALEQKREQRKRDEEARLFAETILVVCPECGKMFRTRRSNTVCCSSECKKRRHNRIQSRRKDKRIAKDKRIDKDITVKKLYKRDNGICWICGGKCDLNDRKTVKGAVVCGNNYPSIDHIIPICEGGEDAWSNVRLAHRICNTLRYSHSKDAPNCVPYPANASIRAV